MASAQKTRVLCKLSPYTQWLPVINDMCRPTTTADGDTEYEGGEPQSQAPASVEYAVSTSSVACGDLASQQPEQSYEGQVDFTAGTTCDGGSSLFADVSIEKVILIG